MRKLIFILCLSLFSSVSRAEIPCVINAREEKVCWGGEVLDLSSIPYEMGVVRALSKEGFALVELVNRANDEHVNGYYRRRADKLSPSVRCVKSLCVGDEIWSSFDIGVERGVIRRLFAVGIAKILLNDRVSQLDKQGWYTRWAAHLSRPSK